MNNILKYNCSPRKLKSNSMLINLSCLIILFLLFSVFKGCIVPYIPKPPENDELLVVEGLISDQHEVNTIKLSKSFPLWTTQNPVYLTGCKVWITDDLGHLDNLKEATIGTYITDSSNFQGTIGRKYTLHIRTNTANGNLNYESFPMELKPVPVIDRIYYEKKTYVKYPRPIEGCQIYLDTYDPTNSCNFYRWKYSETWEFHLPFDVKNKVCWRTENSYDIFLKNTSLLREDRVIGYPLKTITNPIDRLSVKYSIRVKQYSLNEEEYIYWETLKTSLDQAGGLYDIIPPIIPNNIYCVENPDEKTLGYFSVSAVSSRRIFIKDNFEGFDSQYEDCITDTISGKVLVDTLRGLNSFIWMIIDSSDNVPPIRFFTNKRVCADCLARGTNIEPLFWKESK
jgi:Domain of unknown function (DUF4249)